MSVEFYKNVVFYIFINMRKGKLETFFIYLSLFPVLTCKEMLHIISEFFKRRGAKRKLNDRASHSRYFSDELDELDAQFFLLKKEHMFTE